MAAAFSTVVGPRLSTSPTANFRQIRIPARGIMVNSGPFCRRVTMAMSMDKARHDSSIHFNEDPAPAPSPAPLERDFIGTPFVPVYVTLPLGIINMEGEIVDIDSLFNQLNTLKSEANIDGVTIECWWGIVEPHAPRAYNWTAYQKLFKIVRRLHLNLKVVMSFHECAGDDVYIPLPQWVTEIGNKNPDIYFTDKSMRRNCECLTWGIDNEPVLCGRTALEVYFDLMKSFRMEFHEFFEPRTISQIEIGLGPCGELRYPSHSAKFGWKYPGIGEFQCYDEYLFKSLQKAADAYGASYFGKPPENAGSYNSEPQNTEFFRDGGGYNSVYGMFFMNWYSQVLIDHADQVLGMANLAFNDTSIAAKLPGIHWWRNAKIDASHAAKVTAGLASAYKYCYSDIASILKKHGSTLNYACLESGTFDDLKEYLKALDDPERPVWEKEFLKASADAYAILREVLFAAYAAQISTTGQNAHPCYHKEGYNKILENAKTLDDPSCRSRLSIFSYVRLSPTLLKKHNLIEFGRFVRKMHGLPPKVEKQVKPDKSIENPKLGNEKIGLPPEVLHEEKQVKLDKSIEDSKLGDEKK